MASRNPFDLLGDDDNDDPSLLIAKLPAVVSVPVTKKPAASGKPVAKMPTKPLPPTQSVQEAKFDGQRGGGRFGGRGSGRVNRGGRGFNRDPADNDNSYENHNGFNGGFKPSVDGFVEKDSSERRGSFNGPRGGYRGDRRGGYNNGEAEGERPRRTYERHSGTGRSNDMKRDGSGRGNWGNATDDVPLESEEPVVEVEKNVESEKPADQEDGVDASKENPATEAEEKEPEKEEMTLEEYEKVLEEKRKALQGQKPEERRVGLDTELAKMQLLSKGEEEIFVKLGSDKDKRKEAADKEEKAKKSLSINEFLKPAEGERYYGSGGRGRGRGRGPRGGGYSGGNRLAAPAIEDVGQFPSLGVK